MTVPIVFISVNRIKEGRKEDFLQHYLASIPPTRVNKPETLVQLGYLNDGGDEYTVVRVFPSAEALDKQLQGADDRSRITYQFIEPTRLEIYGAPSSYTLDMVKKVAGSGIEVRIWPEYVGGFVRLSTGY